MSFDTTENTKILNTTIKFILLTKRFDETLFKKSQSDHFLRQLRNLFPSFV